MLPVLAASPALVTIPGVLQIAAHAIGIVAVLGLWTRLGQTSFLLAAATLFGLVWLSVDVIDIAITYHVVPALAADAAAGDATAAAAFVELTRLVEAVRLGSHVAGGLWMIGLSAFAIRIRAFSAVVGWLGISVGAVFSANLFVPHS